MIELESTLKNNEK